ncbi:unnamed protein product [Bursaphelenchus xylophilus]|uniref:(pine wood nematode) hypothetical protein n=1 Tax=Bursaphelenchus xylophilus TaxID=6326 RepID=A0A1I7RW03_BURXY|nr:unnamed protein product [Bursaphelenchus xylophilus]CAG9094954.1 unnamed protein product [Bursaphelenchus xylophilus]
MELGGRLEFDDGRYYIGALNDLKPHGLGVMYNANDQEIYAGEFYKGDETTGVKTFPDGAIFEGHLQTTNPHKGLGVQKSAHNCVNYYGEYSRNDEVTNGILRIRNSRCKYSGSIMNNLPHGFGYLTYDCFNLYTGEFVNGKRHGIGQLMTTTYGRATRNRRSRSSASLNAFLDDSEDELAEDVELVGCSSFRSGFTLDLRSREDRDKLMDEELEEDGGFCVLRSTSDFIDPRATEIYVGEWKDDKRNGYGMVTRNNGSSYQGQWKDNKRHGYGITTYADKHVELGRYLNNKLMETTAPSRFNGVSAFRSTVAEAAKIAEEFPEKVKRLEEEMKSRHYAACNKAEKAMEYQIRARNYADDARSVAKQCGKDDNVFVLDQRTWQPKLEEISPQL